ncbi:RBBP9/YdeN family alpha/beta hydrolase [Inquilinus sp. OTU3971]|uniref:RBBP9/YdeN family alpha/beta hydrolase n=1 Tax=Inquilinus sp. OTU3971 TaxID=3043855 RepID=UPI00313CD304
MANIVILPGIGGSGEAHWQTHWQRRHPGAIRLQPTSWDLPDLADWMAALDRAVAATGGVPLLVAHSLACLLVAHWQSASSLPVAGAFLVAVPDPESEAFPIEAAGFAGVPEGRFRFPSLIVASSDDPYGEIEYARARAAQWGSDLVEIGAFGHINSQSGLADWPSGSALFQAFATGAQPCVKR